MNLPKSYAYSNQFPCWNWEKRDLVADCVGGAPQDEMLVATA